MRLVPAPHRGPSSGELAAGTAPTVLRPSDGARFVLYDAGRQHTPPIPVPCQVDDDLPAGWWRDPVNPRHVHLPHPGRCPHGSFLRYAARNCCAPAHGTAAGARVPRRSRELVEATGAWGGWGATPRPGGDVPVRTAS